MIITTKLPETDDENNPGFEPLTDDGDSFGLFILKIRQQLVRWIESERVIFRRISFILFYRK